VGDGGLVYPGFDANVHIVDDFAVPPEWQETISIDPGLNNPLSAHFYCVDYDGNIIVAGEHYKAGEGIEYHAAAIHALADKLGWLKDDKGRLHALIDSAAEQKTLSGTRSVKELFADHGILVNTRVNKDMWTGIARVKELFACRPPRIFIFRSCVNLIREIKAYRWGKGDRPKKVDDHSLDEFRYYVMSKPTAPTIKQKTESIIAQDKRRLARALKRHR
jgi:phage terminase large subunit